MVWRLIKGIVWSGLCLYAGYKIGSCSNPDRYLAPEGIKVIEQTKEKIVSEFNDLTGKLKEFYKKSDLNQ